MADTMEITPELVARKYLELYPTLNAVDLLEGLRQAVARGEDISGAWFTLLEQERDRADQAAADVHCLDNPEDFDGRKPEDDIDFPTLARGLGRKFTDLDMCDQLRDMANDWLTDYAGDFDFLLDLRAKRRNRPLSTGQLRGVLNCMRADVLRADKKAAQPSGRITEDGMYRTPDGAIFKVQRAVHGSGNLYAKQLRQDGNAHWYFDYAPGALRELTPEMKMTLAQAKEFGALYGTCCVCGRTLTNETSIEAGIGPVCAGRFDG